MKNLTDEELALVLEALVFASCVDVCAEWDKDTQQKFVDIASKLKGDKEVTLKNVNLFGSAKLYEDKDIAKQIKKNFKIKAKN